MMAAASANGGGQSGGSRPVPLVRMSLLRSFLRFRADHLDVYS